MKEECEDSLGGGLYSLRVRLGCICSWSLWTRWKRPKVFWHPWPKSTPSWFWLCLGQNHVLEGNFGALWLPGRPHEFQSNLHQGSLVSKLSLPLAPVISAEPSRRGHPRQPDFKTRVKSVKNRYSLIQAEQMWTLSLSLCLHFILYVGMRSMGSWGWMVQQPNSQKVGSPNPGGSWAITSYILSGRYIPALSSDDEYALSSRVYFENFPSLLVFPGFAYQSQNESGRYPYSWNAVAFADNWPVPFSLPPLSNASQVHKILNKDINFWSVALTSFPGTMSYQNNMKHEE